MAARPPWATRRDTRRIRRMCKEVKMSGFVKESTVIVPDGRRLEVVEAGEHDRPALLFQHGTPGAAERFSPWVEAAVSAGWRWLSFTRPGSGGSDRRRGRSIADNCTDVTAILDSLGAGHFVTIGWSGGGPHALACAALLPDRCRGAITVAGLGPVDEMRRSGHDPMAGMGATNAGQFTLARAGEDRLREVFGPAAAYLQQVSGAAVGGMLGDLIAGTVDQDVLTGEFAENIAAGYREAARRGTDGLIDDFLAFDRPWDFDLGAIRVPVAAWHGVHDRMVPPAHSRFLLERVPGARHHVLDDEGHHSLVLQRFHDILAEAVSFLPTAPTLRSDG
jgi:pimeloyl-ACP methyl ester carboxylesterase